MQNCGGRAKRGNEKSTPKRCIDYHSEIVHVLRLNTSGDNETIDSISIIMMR